MAKYKKKYNRIALKGNIGSSAYVPAKTKTLIITQTRRGGIDIGDYTTAIRAAENVDFSSRAKLYDIYEDVLSDPHLYAVIQKRKSAILNTPIEFTRDGEIDEEITEQLRSPWFRSFLSDLLDTIQWGFSVFQFYKEGDWIGYDLIPRKHVDPVRRIILNRQTDIMGESFDDYSDLIMIGNPRDLGLLAKAAPYVIYKRNGMSDFAQFVELYGHPMKEGIYDGYDDEARQKMTEDLFNMGGSPVFIHPKGTEIIVHDNASKGASSDLYAKFIEVNNSELSKLELGNTLTTEAGTKGTQALGTIHQEGEGMITLGDRQFVLDVLSYDLTDTFANLGLNTKDGDFTFKIPENKDLKSRIEIDQKLKTMGLPMSDDYLYETYGVEKPVNYEELKKEQEPAPLPPEDQEDEQEEKIERREKTIRGKGKRFFVFAPGTKGAGQRK